MLLLQNKSQLYITAFSNTGTMAVPGEGKKLIWKLQKPSGAFSHKASQSNPKAVPSDDGKIRTEVRKQPRSIPRSFQSCQRTWSLLPQLRTVFCLEEQTKGSWWCCEILWGSHLWGKILDTSNAWCSCFLQWAWKRKDPWCTDVLLSCCNVQLCLISMRSAAPSSSLQNCEILCDLVLYIDYSKSGILA